MNTSKFDPRRFIAAAIIPPAVATLLVFLGVVIEAHYGAVLFLFLPMIMGFASAAIYSVGNRKPFWQNALAGVSSLAVCGFFIALFAIEGLVCLMMTLPLAVPFNLLGVSIGWLSAKPVETGRSGIGISVLLFVFVPFLMGFEASQKSTPTVHQVVSTVEIDAPIETVWKNVVEFPRIDEEPDGILKFGFAYPINAKIEGEGVGAIRYCNFNTGPFVEPITAWQEPYLLAFDVKKQPAPMTEMTPYEYLNAAHLEFIRSQKGQFRLYEKDGKTVVEGTTIYTQDIAPDVYWRVFSDEIIHQIHLRVLNHIKAVSESNQ